MQHIKIFIAMTEDINGPKKVKIYSAPLGEVRVTVNEALPSLDNSEGVKRKVKLAEETLKNVDLSSFNGETLRGDYQ